MIPLASTRGAFAARSTPTYRCEALIQSPRNPLDTAATRQSPRLEAFLDPGDGFLDIAAAAARPSNTSMRGAVSPRGAIGDAVGIGLTVERTNRRVAAKDPTGPRRVG